MGLTVRGIPSWEADRRWAEAGKFIGPALARNKSAPDLPTIREWIAQRSAQLWGLFDGEAMTAAMVTRLLGKERLQFEIYAFGGRDLREAQKAMETVEALARGRGCAEIVTVAPPGRYGWLRALNGYSASKRGDEMILTKVLQ